MVNLNLKPTKTISNMSKKTTSNESIKKSPKRKVPVPQKQISKESFKTATSSSKEVETYPDRSSSLLQLPERPTRTESQPPVPLMRLPYVQAVDLEELVMLSSTRKKTNISE